MKNENMKGLDVKISDRIARLSEEKRALLLERLKKTGISQKNKIPKRNGTEEAIPLSFAQERLWFLSQLVPEGAAYSEAGAIELAGKLNIAALELALREIVLRHEILRTTFVAQENGYVQQMIAAEFDVKIKYINLDVLSPERQLDQITQGISNEVRQPFNLSSGPLIRFTLFQLSDEKHILLAGLHHIIADAWSIRLLIKELSTIYSAFCSGAPSPLDNLSIQYADYAYWQRDWLKGTGFNEQLVYWMRQLKGCSSLLELPIDMPRPAVLKNLGARYFFNIPSEVTADLNQVAKMHGATMFMTLMATFAILLNRYTQQHDICIGYPIANRSRLETQELIGFFANTLVLRTDCSGNPSFSEFLGRTRTACLAAQKNQDLPFEKLVEELAPIRDMSHHPLFQVMFVLQNANLEKLELPGVKLNEIEVDTGNAKFDLTLSIKEVNGELKGCFEYSTELFYETTIARWATHYRKLLQEITTKFDKPLSDLVILPEEERKQILDHWNDTAAEYSHDQCIHQLIENQVRKEPNAIAIVIEDQQITYDQLNKSASQLAHYLRAQGIGTESRVGIFTERSIEMIIGILAILKAGGAYVPIDPRYPKEHITHVIEDAMLQHVLTQEKFQALIPAQMNRFLLDAQWDEISDQELDSLESIVFPGNLAYVIYTSGSTGKPKGVGVTHRNVVHSTLARLNYYQEPVDGFLLLPSIAFDSSVAGIFGTLCQGGRLVLVSEEAILDPITLSDLILHQQISHLLTIPSLYEAILQKLTGAGKHLKSIIVAGEPCKKSLIDLHYACLPQVELFNEYGPTEATVWSSVHRCQINEEAVIPIGRPIANTCIYLLDAYLNPVSVGITGELYIGGAGLVRGYLNRADVTAECYIPDPFGNPGNRLYRTGDLARYRDNGNIEYVGRVDHQVKIRGFRVELGEIENILLQDSQIKDAVVAAREDTFGNQRLVAYVVGALPTQEIDGIRTKLKEHLPDHMVPAAFVFLDQLPLTPNGKIDRKALPDTDIDVQIAIQYVAPRTDLEDIVANIWAEVLRVERVGIYDNFFELGGHSLLIAQVISRIRQVFAIELPMRILFAKPFVSELAAAIDVERTQGKKCQASSLGSIARSQTLPLSYAQERLWFLDQFEPGSTSYNMPGAVRLTGELDEKLLERSLNEIIRRHEVLRTTFRTVDGEPEQIIAPSLDLEIVSIDLRDLSAEWRESKIQHHLEEDTQKPFDLAQGPLVRASLLFLGD
ncbi:amino acid adenylation domain-containing protein, partial [Nitrosomonas sp.]|uniref:amino acid adenylation domain-containing protein n=1 Tax=Nitrosomonas sp. TaxID=42353 RepID=UPI002731E14F